ncbi:MAG TPA: hypothetical protein VNU68_26640 [Verrucomicrobiae bacterium]|nr:hypothetical protein [Verrucomicrobiae bacterium]
MSADGNPPPSLPAPALPPRPARRGCLFYGCLSVVVLALLLLLGTSLTYFYVKRWIRSYTDATPTVIEKVELSREQWNALQGRLSAFREALDSGQTSAELVLTADEINALMNQQGELRGKLFVRIENNRVTGEGSYPLPNLGPFKLKGRYLNGTATFKITLDHGQCDVRIQDATVKSRPLPAIFMRELRKQNLAQNIEDDPSISTNLAKFESIQIRDGQVILRTKGAAKP